MPVCRFLKKGLTIRSDGAVEPCCAWQDVESKDRVYINDDWQKKYDSAYNRLKSGWIPECRECEVGEKTNGHSVRLSGNQELSATDSREIQYIDLKLSTACTLSCVMCASHSSSSWAKKVKQHDELQGTVYSFGLNKRNAWNKTYGLNIEDFYGVFKDVRVIKFTGGEPFIIPEVKKIIQMLVAQDIAKNVVLKITTNGQQEFLSWNEWFKQFKRVDITCSVDATHDLYEYIRTGASWDLLDENIREIMKVKAKNTHLMITALPMSINIDTLHNVESWAHSVGASYAVAVECIEPDVFSPNTLEDPKKINQLITQLKLLDNINNTDYTRVITHLGN